MALFGEKKAHTAEDQATRTMIDWANDVPPADLAAQLMPAFGPDRPEDDATSVRDDNLVEWLFHGYPKPSISQLAGYRNQLRTPIREAVQLLEHAELVFVSNASTDDPYWRATRLGLATLASGKAAVRQRIKDRTGL
jgi:hypothetical protein